MPDGPGDTQGWKKDNWAQELYVVERMLDADARNCELPFPRAVLWSLSAVVQAWNYRRYVLGSMPVPRAPSSELAYTTRKIEANFSNFSAWHQRSKVFSSLWDSGQLDRMESLEQEFELVRNAMYTDPDDQSVWVYHRWLVGSGQDRELLEREIGVIQELLDEQPDSKWCMESLVHYKRLQLQQRPGNERLKQECVDLLRELERIDAARRERYSDIFGALL